MAAHIGGKVRTGTARTAMSRIRVRRPFIRSSVQATPVEKPTHVSSRAIGIGHLIHPDTGLIFSKAFLSLPEMQGMNEAINVYGAPSTGKSVVIRSLIEYFSIVEGRSVIVIDPTKNQYWSLGYKQDRPGMIETLRRAGIAPTYIPDVKVYVPVYDEPILTWRIMQQKWHATDLLSIKTSGLTPASFFMLGDKNSKGKDFQRYLEEILSRPGAEKTIKYIAGELNKLASEPSTTRSAQALINIFMPLVRMGVIRDDGTDVKDMLHPRRTGRPGQVSIISLGTNSTDRRRDALLTTIMQQIMDYTRDDETLRPVFVMDETRLFAPRERGEHEDTRDAIVNFHMLVRAFGVTRVFGFQYQNQVVDALIGENTPYNIQLENTLMLSGKTETKMVEGKGQAHIFVDGVGDPSVPKINFLAKFLPCRTKHVD